jgi:NAD+ kinase
MKRVLINANFEKPKALEVLKRFERWALKNSVLIYSFDNSKNYSKAIKSLKRIPSAEQMNKIRREFFAVSFGGDGTMLSTARKVSEIDIPLLGINLGSLGFLSTVREDLMEERLDMVIKNRFKTESCDLLSAERKTKKIMAFNDIIMISKEPQRLLKIKIDVDGKNISDMSADGVIIATPKGSTAYSMAAGGPIVFSNVGCFIITPICPHLLVQRAIVIKNSSKIELTPISSDALISGDSQSRVEIKRNEKVIVRKHKNNVRLIKFDDTDFIDIMKEKFFLGRDPRL